jgi:hypothetical protein
LLPCSSKADAGFEHYRLAMDATLAGQRRPQDFSVSEPGTQASWSLSCAGKPIHDRGTRFVYALRSAPGLCKHCELAVGTRSGGCDLTRLFEVRLAVEHLRIFRDAVKDCVEMYLQGGV